MSFLKNKKWLFVIFLMISALAGLSNFQEPSNLLVAGSIGLSLLIVIGGDELAMLYLLIALCPFYSSLRIGSVYAGFIISVVILIKLLLRKSTKHSPALGFFAVVFLLIWFAHDLQFVTFASALFRLLVPSCVFMFICSRNLNGYDGYYAMWLVICTTLISMFCIFMVQGGSLDAFIYASYAGEIRLGEADVDEGQKNQLGGAMGFPIYTILVVSLFIQMLMTRTFRAWQKILIIVLMISLFFVTFLTISRVYILGITTLALLLLLHMVRSKSSKTIVGILMGAVVVYVIASIYLPDYMSGIFDSYLTRQMNNSDNGGTGIRGEIYQDCIKFLTEDIECLLIGKGSSAYPLLGAKIGRMFSWSAHNFILDALMSFGLFGSFLLFSMYYGLFKQERYKNSLNWTVFRIIPLGCFLMMNMTATPFLLDKTYPMLLFLIMNIIHCTDRSEYNPEWAKSNMLSPKNI